MPCDVQCSCMAFFKRRPKPLTIESPDQLEELARTGLPVFVDFMQFSCGPCQIMDGVVNELAEEFEGSAHVVKVNAAHVPAAFDRYQVRSTPTFVILTARDGANSITQRWRGSGLIQKDQLVKSLMAAGAQPTD